MVAISIDECYKMFLEIRASKGRSLNAGSLGCPVLRKSLNRFLLAIRLPKDVDQRGVFSRSSRFKV